MKLANNLKKALARKYAGAWKANDFAMRTRRGQAKLKDLYFLASEAQCSLVYLTSGGEYEERDHMTPEAGVLKSIMHAGHDKHDFARMMGFRSYAYVADMLRKRTIPVKALLKFSEALKMPIYELLCDGECFKIDYDHKPPSQWWHLVKLNQMGWFDAKPRGQGKAKKGPGL